MGVKDVSYSQGAKGAKDDSCSTVFFVEVRDSQRAKTIVFNSFNSLNSFNSSLPVRKGTKNLNDCKL